jgi:hypothetical protein
MTMHTIEAGARLTALGLGGLLLYAISLYRWPWRPCTWCKGSGLSRGSDKRRHGRCWRCHGTKQVQRLGSRSVHRLAWAIRGEFGRARARRAAQKARERSMHPRDLADRDN